MTQQAENPNLEANEPLEGQEGQQDQEPEEFEISTGDSPSQETRGNPVVRRLIGQREKLRESNSEKENEIEALKAEVALLKETKAPSNGAPKWEDFDTEDDYREAVLNWSQGQSRQPNPGEMFQQFEQKQRFDKAINKHYQRAEELSQQFPDYSQAEQVAIETLGQDLVNEITAASDKSTELMLYFGRNPEAAQRFRQLSKSNGTQAAIELGRLEATLKVQPKAKTPTPEPDEPLTGGSTVSSSQKTFEKRLEKARSDGDTNLAIAIKREARGAGINL